MKNELLKIQDITSEYPSENELFGESLDLSELICIKGGKEEEKESSGHAGGLFCWC